MQRPSVYVAVPETAPGLVARNSPSPSPSQGGPTLANGADERVLHRVRSVERVQLYGGRFKAEDAVHLIPLVILACYLVLSVPTVYKAYNDPYGAFPQAIKGRSMVMQSDSKANRLIKESPVDEEDAAPSEDEESLLEDEGRVQAASLSVADVRARLKQAFGSTDHRRPPSQVFPARKTKTDQQQSERPDVIADIETLKAQIDEVSGSITRAAEAGGDTSVKEVRNDVREAVSVVAAEMMATMSLSEEEKDEIKATTEPKQSSRLDEIRKEVDKAIEGGKLERAVARKQGGKKLGGRKIGQEKDKVTVAL